MKLKESKFKFERPILKRFSFNENGNFEERKELKIEIELEKRIEKEEKNGEVSVIFKTVNSNKIPFFIEIEMYSKFIWEEGLTEQEIKNALEINAPSLLVSYVRPLIALITGNSKYPSWNIPFLDMRKTSEEK
jgi:preprotein translocase subunit secB